MAELSILHDTSEAHLKKSRGPRSHPRHRPITHPIEAAPPKNMSAATPAIAAGHHSFKRTAPHTTNMLTRASARDAQ